MTRSLFPLLSARGNDLVNQQTTANTSTPNLAHPQLCMAWQRERQQEKVYNQLRNCRNFKQGRVLLISVMRTCLNVLLYCSHFKEKIDKLKEDQKRKSHGLWKSFLQTGSKTHSLFKPFQKSGQSWLDYNAYNEDISGRMHTHKKITILIVKFEEKLETKIQILFLFQNVYFFRDFNCS